MSARASAVAVDRAPTWNYKDKTLAGALVEKWANGMKGEK